MAIKIPKRSIDIEIKDLKSIIKSLEKDLESVPKRSIEANIIRTKIKIRNHMLESINKLKKKQ